MIELRRGLSSSTTSTGVFEYTPPSQYGSPSILIAGNAGGSAPDDVLERQSRIAGIEIAHRARARIDRADGQARVARVQQLGIDQRCKVSRSGAIR